MVFVGRISCQNFILGNQTLGAFGKKDFVTELQRRSDLATLDQISVGFKDGIDLLGVGNLLSFDHSAARLIDHTVSQFAVAIDLLTQLLDRQIGKRVLAASLPGLNECRSSLFNDLLGNSNEFTIFADLLMLSLCRRHPLDCLHPPPRCARAIAKTLDRPLNRFLEPADEAGDHTDHIPYNSEIGIAHNNVLSVG